MKRKSHGFDREQRGDVEVNGVAAGQYRLYPAQGRLRGRALGQPLHRAGEVDIDELDVSTELYDENVAIERREVEERTVERVALCAGRARALPLLQIAQRTGGAPRLGSTTPAHIAECLLERGCLGCVQRLDNRGRFLPGSVHEVGSRREAAAHIRDLRRHLEHLAASSLRLRISGKPASATDV